MALCSICGKIIENKDAPILVMGAYGIPRYLCDGCSEELDTVTGSKVYDDIAEAMNSLGEKLSRYEADDLSVETVNEIMSAAAERAKAIKDGTYDFSLDEQVENTDDVFDDIPEELKESEEDKALDEAEQEKIKKVESVFNVISAILFSAVGAYALYMILDMFLF